MSIEWDENVVAVPKHLELPFYEEVLENAVRCNNLHIERIHLTMGSSTGENYLSQIYRVRIEYREATDKEQTLLTIIKSIPIIEGTNFLQDFAVFLKERIFYTTILPKLEVLLPPKVKLGPRLYHSLRTPVQTFALEDLSERQFRMASRVAGLDEEHSLLAVRRLAQMHATSMVLAAKEPELMEAFGTGILTEKILNGEDGNIIRYYSYNLDAMIKRVSEWPGYETITAKLKNYYANLATNLTRTQLPRAGEMCVLNHGDAWVNNMLFQYDKNNKLSDLIFVDFQMAVWMGPGIDLNYFLHTSCQLEVLKNRRSHLIRAYHHELSTMLKSLQYPVIPSLEQIEEDIRIRSPYAFFAVFGILPLVCLEKNPANDTSLESLLDKDSLAAKAKQLFASSIMEERLRYVLREFEELGVWD